MKPIRTLSLTATILAFLATGAGVKSGKPKPDVKVHCYAAFPQDTEEREFVRELLQEGAVSKVKMYVETQRRLSVLPFLQVDTLSPEIVFLGDGQKARGGVMFYGVFLTHHNDDELVYGTAGDEILRLRVHKPICSPFTSYVRVPTEPRFTKPPRP